MFGKAATNEPLALYRTEVLPEWIDYNGHMNVAYYTLAFDKATDAFLDHIGLGETYRRDTNHSIFVLESHVTFGREVKMGDPLGFTVQLIDADEKRMHLFQRMFHNEAGYMAATVEMMMLHVDLTGPRSSPIPEAARSQLGMILAQHRQLPKPPELGRKIGIPRGFNG